jgi:hypothetical protein
VANEEASPPFAFDYWAQNPVLTGVSVIAAIATAVGMLYYFRGLPSVELRSVDLVSSWALCTVVVTASFLVPPLIGGNPGTVSRFWQTMICVITAGIPMQAIGITLALSYTRRSVGARPKGQPDIENIHNR